MERRRFLSYLCRVPLVSYAAVALTRCGPEPGKSRLAGRPTEGPPVTAFQTFAYYQGLGETETRDPERTDGTAYDMPCISALDIAAGFEKSYDFWHGHSGKLHRFTVTTDDFKKLQSGHNVEVYTSIVEDHRHSLVVSPTRRCESKAC